MIMNQLQKIITLVLLWLPHALQGMDFSGEIEKLVQSNKHPLYNSLSDCDLSISDNSNKQEDLSIFLKKSKKQLPKELKIIIGKMFLKLYLREHELDDIELEPLSTLNLLCRAQNMCPLTIGNKTFQWKDILRLTNEHQKKLYIMGNPPAWYTCLTGFDNHHVEASDSYCTKALYCLPKYCCGAIGPDMQFLEDQPEHIKKNLIVQEANYKLAHYGCYFCTGEAVFMPLLACCGLNTTPGVTSSIFCAGTIAAFLINRLLLTTECSCCGYLMAREKKFK